MFKIIAVFVLLEALSLLSFISNQLSLPILIIIGIGTLVLSIKNLEWGIYILFGELFIGSRGRLLEHDFISLRMVIFAAVLAAWGLQILNSKSEIRNKFSALGGSAFGGKILYLALLGIIFAGAIHGFFAGNGLKNVFQDANGYLYLLILPAVLSGIRSRQAVENLLKILAAAVLVIAAKTLILFIWFSYGLPGVAAAYHWIIERDAGEITGVVGSASRIFMQSQFWALMALFIFYFYRRSRIVVGAALLSVILSLSRSFWLGLFAGALFAAAVLVFHFKERLRQIIKPALVLLLIAFLEIGGLFLIIKIGTAGFSGSVSSRAINPAREAAGGARLLLLPELVSEIKDSPLVGKGFGETVTYKSYLPDRTSLQNPDGEITTFAFEWGYLDTALKVGVLGLLIYLLFIANVFAQGWKAVQVQSSKFKVQNLGFLAGLVALLTLNITTPYLNHPLGIGFLILHFTLSTFHFHDEAPG